MCVAAQFTTAVWRSTSEDRTDSRVGVRQCHSLKLVYLNLVKCRDQFQSHSRCVQRLRDFLVCIQWEKLLQLYRITLQGTV